MKPQKKVFFPINADKERVTIAMCGRQISEKGQAVPPRVYPIHNLTFVVKGSGVFHSIYGDHRVTAGNGYLIEGGSTVSYEADERDPWEYVFITFRGDVCNEALRLSGISAERPVFRYQLTDDNLRLLNDFLCSSSENRSAGYDTLGYFLVLMSKLIPRNTPAVPDDHSALRTQEIVSYIESNFDRNITVQELSKRFYIDRSAIYRLFKRDFGTSPKAFILRCRLNRAAEMLCSDDAGIDDVAVSCGFYDRAHFNKYFTDYFGIAPGKYRGERKRKKA
ncbi:MAG: helix-turn-helix domain-containing protein [Firmicutes bacterium]|nr:helix-turn-helix domain-containing protein [Candidatus Colimorpha enterica]